MKLQISFDHTDIDQALETAHKVQEYSDIIEVGSLLIYKYGSSAITRFKETFPDKIILADAKIVDRAKDAVNIFALAGADWITVLSGANKSVIQSATMTAHELGKKIMLDLIDSQSLGQSALESKGLGIDSIIFHKHLIESEQIPFLERWEIVKGNTTLPIYIHSPVTKDNVTELLSLGASGIVISNVNSEDSDQNIRLIHSIINPNHISNE